MFRADLHCHSNCSDGSDSPSKLLQIAKVIGLQGLSITDHDTLDAYSKELFEEAGKLGIRLLRGVEISSQKEQVAVHILGYNVDDSIKPFLQKIQVMREDRNKQILQKLTLRKMPITEEELKAFAPHRTVGRPHIAQLMVKKKYVQTEREAFDRYLKEEGPCYAQGFKYSPEEVIEAIHEAGGLAVLAHPHFFKKTNLVKKLLNLPFDGIECFYARLTPGLETPWVKISKEKGWIATGGSDYHGATKPLSILGSSWVGEDIFRKLSCGK